MYPSCYFAAPAAIKAGIPTAKPVRKLLAFKGTNETREQNSTKYKSHRMIHIGTNTQSECARCIRTYQTLGRSGRADGFDVADAILTAAVSSRSGTLGGPYTIGVSAEIGRPPLIRRIPLPNHTRSRRFA